MRILWNFVAIAVIAFAICSCSKRAGSSFDTAIVITTHGADRVLEEGKWITRRYPGADTRNTKLIGHRSRKGRWYDHLFFSTPFGEREMYFDVTADSFPSNLKPVDDPIGPTALGEKPQRASETMRSNQALQPTAGRSDV
jgi:hypothetical protein